MAESAGGQPETLAPVPSTISLPDRSGSPSSGSTTSTSTSVGDNQTKKSSPNVGAIVGGVIGGLAFLAAVGFGIWIFLRRRASARGTATYGGIDGDYPDYPRYSDGPIMSEHSVQPSQMRLYVGHFVILSDFILTCVDRTRPTHPPTPATVITNRLGYTRPTMVVTTVPRNYEQLSEVLFFYNSRTLTLWLGIYPTVLLSTTSRHMG